MLNFQLVVYSCFRNTLCLCNKVLYLRCTDIIQELSWYIFNDSKALYTLRRPVREATVKIVLLKSRVERSGRISAGSLALEWPAALSE